MRRLAATRPIHATLFSMTPPLDANRCGLRPPVWWLAIRPRTLSLSAIPVLVGTTLAWYEGAAMAWTPFLVALMCALLIQAGTNLFNDAGDALRGNDGPARLGPLRVSAGGLATPGQVECAAYATFLAALLGGGYLVAIGGWPILVIGLASLAAGWAYSSGPRPLSHTAWGEVFVLLFFGLAAVAGSHYLQSGKLMLPPLWIGLALGCHAAAVLLVNNVRDLETDRLAGRRTLAAVIGLNAARHLYAALMLAPFAILVLQLGSITLGAGWLALPICLWLSIRFRRLPRTAEMNNQLTLTALAQILLGVLLCAALLW